MPVPAWKKGINPAANGERRKLVTVQLPNGQTAVTVRAWTGTDWIQPAFDTSTIVAWDELPAGALSNGLAKGITPSS